jgi:hypothetical protein
MLWWMRAWEEEYLPLNEPFGCEPRSAIFAEWHSGASLSRGREHEGVREACPHVLRSMPGVRSRAATTPRSPVVV